MIGALFRRAPDWRVRDAGSQDAAAIAELHGKSFARGWSEDEILALLADRQVLAHVLIRAPGQPISGFCLARAAADEAEILSIAVASALRARGGGHALLAASLNAIARLGAARVVLEVDEDNASALKLYGRFVFKEVGRRPAYYARPDGTRGSARVLAAALR